VSKLKTSRTLSQRGSIEMQSCAVGKKLMIAPRVNTPLGLGWRSEPTPFDLNWRMAYIGTVSFIDAYGETLTVRRYASPACDHAFQRGCGRAGARRGGEAAGLLAAS
jgi:hypothetical protein